MIHRFAIVIASSLVVSAGCGGKDGDTDGASTDGTTSDASTDSTGATGGEGGPPRCIDTPTVLAPDATTPLGVSAEEFLFGKIGGRAATLTFASEPVTLSDAWKGKALFLTVELRYQGGEVRWIDSEVDPAWDPTGNESGLADACSDRLEIDVLFDFLTEKEFAEHSAAVLTATSVERADLIAELVPPGLSGPLDLTTIYADPEWVITALRVTGTWNENGAVGGCLINEVRVGGETGSIGVGSLAAWGAPTDPC